MQKFFFFCSFYDVFLRVGVTKYCKIHGKVLADSVAALWYHPWAPLSNTVRTLRAKAIWGTFKISAFCFAFVA